MAQVLVKYCYDYHSKNGDTQNKLDSSLFLTQLAYFKTL